MVFSFNRKNWRLSLISRLCFYIFCLNRMSSLNRGAPGTIKPKAVNVNTFFSGRNLAPGQRANGRYGMQSVGKTAGVVRRMPPPATLPSLKAENNGQDPTTQVVPQGGSGWSKTESIDIPSAPAATTAVAPNSAPPIVASPPTNDLRPSWLQNEKSGASEPKDVPTNATPSATLPPPTTSSEKAKVEPIVEKKSAQDFTDRVPSRFLDNTSTSTKNVKSKNNRISDDEGFDSQQDKDRNCSTEESGWSSHGSPNPSETATTVSGTPKAEVSNRTKVNGDTNHHRANDIRILKRTEHLLLQDISDDDEEIQMTRLDKPNVNIIKRRAGAEGNSHAPVLTNGTKKNSPGNNSSNKSNSSSSAVNGKKNSKKNKQEHSQKIEKSEFAKTDDSLNGDDSQTPIQMENVWAKRQEERESQEREKEKSAIPRVMQQAIEQHFPLVTEAATIKVDKESTRKSIDSEFARAAIRARKLPASNDVRRLYPSSAQSNSTNSTTINSNIQADPKKIVNSDDVSDENLEFKKGQKNRQDENEQNLVAPGRDRKDSHRSNLSHDSGRNGHTTQKRGARGGIRNRFTNGVKSDAISKEKITNDETSEKKKSPKSLAKKKEVKPQQAAPSEDNKSDENQKTAGGKNKKEQAKNKAARQENRLFIPKALRKESDDLPANGLLSGKSGKSKDEAEIDRGFNAIVTEMSNLVGVEKEPENCGSIEFAEEIEVSSADQEAYDFTFDPQFHGNSTIEKAAIQQVISAVSSDDASLKEKMIRIKDLWTVVSDGERTNVAMVKPQPQVGEVVVLDNVKEGFVQPSCRGASNNPTIGASSNMPVPNGPIGPPNNSLAPFSGHYSAFQPLYQNNDGRLANTANSPPNNYLSNYTTKQMDNRGTGLAQPHNIWNSGHLDIAALSGTPPPSIFSNSNGAYGYFSTTNQNGTNFGGQQHQYFDRPALPPANLAVGSQRANNMFNASNAPPNSATNNRHPMNGLTTNGGGQAAFPNFFNQPPPPVQQPPHLRMAPNGATQQDNCMNYYANAGRIPQRPFHPSEQLVWPGVNNANFMNGPPPPPPQAQGWNQQPPAINSKYWPNQNLNRMRRTAPPQSNRQ
ncbi:unnamed protein product [Caenorhabditis angaria]|uniref:BAT2 N-terminal domain-containing protein n=1 Tax=Caenorhabditis angaria TaxID=860376 RepID=A0A9P1N8U9_9PELO|nr:unnamed protein product [Caenorhabditis angaria]